MNAPKAGETAKYLRTGGLFQVSKVVNGFVILCSADGASQIMTGVEHFDLLFSRISAEESPGRNFNPGTGFTPVAGRVI